MQDWQSVFDNMGYRVCWVDSGGTVLILGYYQMSDSAIK